MSNQMTINTSFFDKLESLEDQVEEKLEDIMQNLASLAVSYSPVDTGAYVTSFSLVPNNGGGGRSRRSDNKPTGQNEQVMRDQGYSQMMEDLARISLRETTSITIRNRSPHANSVEDGGPNWRRSGYGVFRKLRNES